MLRSALGLLVCLTGVSLAQENFTNDPFAQFGSTPGKEVTASLVSEGATFIPGKPFTVALKLEHSGPWHTYWLNPGITGQATSIKWELPAGFIAGPIQWPVPHSKEDVIGRTNYFDGIIYLLTDITAPATAPIGEAVSITAKAKWLRCAETCVPGKGDFTIKLTAQNAAIKPDPEFEKVRGQQPRSSDKIEVAIQDEGGSVKITVTPKTDGNPDPGEVTFFHTDGKVFDEPSTLAKREGDSYTATFKKAEGAGKVETVHGFAHAAKSWLKDGSLTSLALSPDAAPAQGAGAAATPAENAVASAGISFPSEVTPDEEAAMKEIIGWGLTGAGEKSKPFLLILGFAFLGGLILNLMPCVFPVLGLKIMGFVSQSGEEKSRIRMHGLAFGAGVLLSMWALVAALLAVKAATGDTIVWGEQLRQPWFVALMIGVIFAFGLSLAGLFEFGVSLTSAGGNLQHQKGYSGSFFSGLLTVLIASPCTGPFMAPAISFAFNQAAIVAILIFTVLGLGLAFPYIFLSFFPALIKKLPRPGAWMETFKQLMAFPMLATVVWLMSVYGKQVGVDGLVWLLAAMLILGFGLWIYGRYATPLKKAHVKWTGRLAAAVCLVASMLIVKATMENPEPRDAVVNAAGMIKYHGIEWEPFSLRKIVEHRKNGRKVFVDFTAEW